MDILSCYLLSSSLAIHPLIVKGGVVLSSLPENVITECHVFVSGVKERTAIHQKLNFYWPHQINRIIYQDSAFK